MCQQKIAEIKAQIDMAKSQARATGVYSDAVWFVKANAALRYTQAEMQRAQYRLGEQRRTEAAVRNAADSESFLRHLLAAAKEQLGEDGYRDLIAAARSRQKTES